MSKPNLKLNTNLDKYFHKDLNIVHNQQEITIVRISVLSNYNKSTQVQGTFALKWNATLIPP